MNRKPFTNSSADHRTVSEGGLFDLIARLETCSSIVRTIGARCEDMNPCVISEALSGAANLLDYIIKDFDEPATAPTAGREARA